MIEWRKRNSKEIEIINLVIGNGGNFSGESF